MRAHFCFTLLTALILFSLLPAQTTIPGNAHFGNVNEISEKKLREYLTFIASDQLQGRDTPSPGLDSAAAYIASHMAQWEYTPSGDSGSYFQKIKLLRNRIIPTKTFVEIDGKKYFFGEDMIASPAAINISAPLVYVSNGFIVTAKNINPYKGIDVTGKIMVVLGGYPQGVSFQDFSGKRGVDFDTPT
ncbi:MAG: hypothetical protein PHP42_09290, partial [Bacteroidota bacterium]|nr:hypothetical protein [Bacteroidota bacterium]